MAIPPFNKVNGIISVEKTNRFRPEYFFPVIDPKIIAILFMSHADDLITGSKNKM